jgi:nicotinate-nucleotide pyrophosphorylase (carboxylating)
MVFSAAETACCRRLIDWALEDDLGTVGDVTSVSTIPIDLEGQVVFVARSAGVVAGLPAVGMVLDAVDPRITFQAILEDGTQVEAGTRLATAAGPMRGLLAAERSALNFLQRLSGIASRTRSYVDAVAGTRARILDTRKTLPGWRILEKYAVRCGGGHNHRMGLFDGVLIKDNHLAALGSGPGTIARAVGAARALTGRSIPVELEIDGLDQLDEALASRPDIILLDNMRPEELRSAVARRDAAGREVLLEASGGVNLSTVAGIAGTGVDRISVGDLTHSAPALDIGLDFLR